MKNQAHFEIALLKKGGGTTILKEGYMSNDKFQALLSTTGDGLSRVSTTYKRQLKYAEEGITVTVSCACDQNEPMINEAGKQTFLKALELVDDNWGLLQEAMKQEAEKHQ